MFFWSVRLYKKRWSGLDANIFLWYNISWRVRSTLHSYQIQLNIYLFTYYRRPAANTKTKVRLVITYIYGQQGYYTQLRFVAVCNCRPFCFAWLCCKVTVETSKYRAIFALLPTQSGKQSGTNPMPLTAQMWAFVSKIQDPKYLSLSPYKGEQRKE